MEDGKRMATTTAAYPLKQQRKRAAQQFGLRVFLLLTLIAGVAYIAWFAPNSRHAPRVEIEAVP